MLMQLLYLFTDFSFYSIVTVIIFVIGPLAVDQLYSPTLCCLLQFIMYVDWLIIIINKIPVIVNFKKGIMQQEF